MLPAKFQPEQCNHQSFWGFLFVLRRSLVLLLEDGSENVAEIVVIDSFIGKSIVFFGVRTHILFWPHNWDVPFMRSFNVVLDTQRALICVGCASHEFYELCVQFSWIEVWRVAFLCTEVHLLCDIQQLRHHSLAFSIHALPHSCLVHPSELSESLQRVVDLNTVLFSVSLEQFFPFEAGIDLSGLLLLSDLLSLKGLVLDDDGFVLPSSPDLVLDLFLLLRGLLDSGQDTSLSSGDFDELIFFGLFYDHLSPSLLALMLLLLTLSACKPALFPSLRRSRIDDLTLLFDCRHSSWWLTLYLRVRIRLSTAKVPPLKISNIAL